MNSCGVLKFRDNNFDLIRLVAAIQVAVYHACVHLGLDGQESWGFRLLELFPGVPVFFFVSGFLISRSFESNSDLGLYVRSRVIRLFPALIVCSFVTIVTIVCSGYFGEVNVPVADFLIWLLAQLTVFQFYDPDFLAGYGIGQTNGSLWTVYIEIQFYVLIPLVYIFVLSRLSDKWSLLLLIFSAVIFLVFNRIFYLHNEILVYPELFKKTFLPYLYMFIVGVIFQRKFDFFHNLLAGRFILVFLVYVFTALVLTGYSGFHLHNEIGPLLFMILSLVVFSFAFSYRTLSGKLLSGHDISYGIYIYHMPVVSFFIYIEFTGNMAFLGFSLLTLTVAILSWFAVEKPFMKLKKKSIRPV
ncbi:acyltransferase [uncultured Pseudoteredinibacter sp.]|uniref:acyltransferase family protein n=1 Tax=uncultured Pseudoteredinibacter sp. TaxID=1641701 RepID=UPI0026260BD4|nr:acyltransferase [uncultured Pseudoteredinibacter sp.]